MDYVDFTSKCIQGGSVWYDWDLAVCTIEFIYRWTRMQLAESQSQINACVSLAVTLKQTCFILKR